MQHRPARQNLEVIDLELHARIISKYKDSWDWNKFSKWCTYYIEKLDWSK